MYNNISAVIIDNDTRSNVDFLTTILKLHNVSYAIIENISKAIDYFEFGLNVDLLLLDWTNKSESDKESTKRFLKGLRLKGYDAPIVIMTYQGDKTEREILCKEELFEFGAIAVLHKPFDKEDLERQITAIHKIIMNKRKAQSVCDNVIPLFNKLKSERLANGLF